MSAISTILTRLRNAIWAIDVRDYIADAIEQCYADVSNPTLQTEALETALQNKIEQGEMAALTIGDGTITTAKIADGAITQDKLADDISFETDTTLTQADVPADAEATGAAINEVKANLLACLIPKSHIAGTSADALTETGIYFSSTTSDYPNGTITDTPYTMGWLVVIRHSASSDVVFQIFYPYSGIDNVPKRRYHTYNGTWQEWIEFVDTSDTKGILSSTDLNTVVDEGVYYLGSNTSYTNSPLPSGKSGTLEVFAGYENLIVQRITRYDGANVYYRTSSNTGSFLDRAWNETSITTNYNNTYTTEHYDNTYSITCSPTITTDTNNFLASTNDTTDRTGDIQTMLNTTGVCHLGPGVFYVTGITVGNHQTLIGSGSSTKLILDSSVTDGYTILMKNFACVKNMRICGTGSSYEPSSATIGTRNGILFEGNADASAEADRDRRYMGMIEGCHFWYFDGSGLKCTNTGGKIHSNILMSDCFFFNCDVGINIAYNSEFHRFTNVSATHCYYGCICNGGNCNFTNCSFSNDMVGILMDNGTGQSPNNSHGVFSACTICHSGSNNDGVALRLLRMVKGEIFTGLQIHYGSIEVSDSTAIRFLGCQFGHAVPFTLTNNTVITLSDCSFAGKTYDENGNVTGNYNPITESGNTALHFKDCYAYNGDVVTA